MEEKKEPVFIAITGTQHYFGTDFFKVGLVLQLIKDPANPHDGEAIRAEIPPIGKVGYVANSSHTVPRGCRSAGRVYDTFGEVALAKVIFVVKDTVIAELLQADEEWQKVYTAEDTDDAEWTPPTRSIPTVRCLVITPDEP